MKHQFYVLSAFLMLFFLLISPVLAQAYIAPNNADYDTGRAPISLSASGSAPNAQPAASRLVSYTYDGASRLISDGRCITYRYDAASNLLARTMVAQRLYLPVRLKRS